MTRGYLANGRGQEVEGSWSWKEPDKILGKGWRSADAVYEVSDKEHYEDCKISIDIDEYENEDDILPISKYELGKDTDEDED